MFSGNKNMLELFHTNLKYSQNQKIKRQLFNAQLSIVIQNCNFELTCMKLQKGAKSPHCSFEFINKGKI